MIDALMDHRLSFKFLREKETTVSRARSTYNKSKPDKCPRHVYDDVYTVPVDAPNQAQRAQHSTALMCLAHSAKRLTWTKARSM